MYGIQIKLNYLPKLNTILIFILNPQIGQSLKCYDCPTWGSECAFPGDENIGKLIECPESPRAACLTNHRYGGPVRGCTELPDQINDKDCIMRNEITIPLWNLYYFVCYCTTDGCNTLDDPPCGSVPGYCDFPAQK